MSQQHTIGKVATTVKTRDGWTIITYHQTDVVKFNGEEIILDSGGWQTATTKTRMNQTSNQFDLGFGVFQKDYQWFVDFKGQTIDFCDGLVLQR